VRAGKRGVQRVRNEMISDGERGLSVRSSAHVVVPAADHCHRRRCGASTKSFAPRAAAADFRQRRA